MIIAGADKAACMRGGAIRTAVPGRSPNSAIFAADEFAEVVAVAIVSAELAPTCALPVPVELMFCCADGWLTRFEQE
jgi:hypothetical protein